MFGSTFSNFIGSVRKTVIDTALKSDLGKEYALKPVLKEKILDARKSLFSVNERRQAISAFERETQLDKAFKDLLLSGEQIIDGLTQKETLNKLTEILAKFEDIYKVANSLSNKESVKELNSFALSLINYPALQSLLLTLENLNQFERLDPGLQAEIAEELQSGELLKQLLRQSQSITLELVQEKVGALAQKLCSELDLESSDAKEIQLILNGIVDEHFEKVNQAKETLLEQLPNILKKEQARIEKAFPEVLASIKAPSAVCHQAGSSSQPESDGAASLKVVSQPSQTDQQDKAKEEVKKLTN